MNADSVQIKIGIIGKILAGDDIGQYVKIEDDSQSTGGFLILTNLEVDFTGEGFDNWVKDYKSLQKYFKESNWKISWLNKS